MPLSQLCGSLETSCFSCRGRADSASPCLLFLVFYSLWSEYQIMSARFYIKSRPAVLRCSASVKTQVHGTSAEGHARDGHQQFLLILIAFVQFVPRTQNNLLSPNQKTPGLFSHHSANSERLDLSLISSRDL